MSTAHTWSFESDQIGAEMGWVCWTAGDVDNDGYDDVVVGAPYYDHLRTDEGKIWVFSGSASGLSTTPVWTMTGGQTSAEAGYYGFRAGDVNGDLRGDIVVGAPAYGGGFSDEGRAYVFHGPLSEATGGDCPQ